MALASTTGPTASTQAPQDEASDATTLGSASTGAVEAGLDACATAASLVVATFNVRFDPGTEASASASHGWENPMTPRRDGVIAVIEDMDPDLLGVQEPFAHQVADLMAALPGYGFVGVGRNDGVAEDEFEGIFYRRERFVLLDEGHFWLSDTPDVPGTVFPDSGWIRMATWITVRDLVAGRELFMLNTHWDNESQSSRERSAELISERLGVLPEGRPIIVTGDLNQTETNVALRKLLSPESSTSPPLIDAYRSVFPMPRSQESTYHDFTGETVGERIDYVLHDASFEAVDAVIRTDTFGGRYPSDHFPVRATLQWARDADGTPCDR